MASAFWGGFADTLLDENKRKAAEKQALEAYRKKKEIDLSFETTEVEDLAAGEVQKVDSDGNIKSRRKLTSSEIERRMATKDLLIAQLDGAKATAGKAKKDLENYDDDRQFEMDDKNRARALAERQTDISAGHLGVAQQNASLQKERQGLEMAQYRDNNAPETFAAGEFQRVAEEVQKLGAHPGPTKRVLVTVQGRINEVLADKSLSPQAKKIKIKNLTNAAIGQMTLPQDVRKPYVPSTSIRLDGSQEK